jgi:hypothetical protein
MNTPPIPASARLQALAALTAMTVALAACDGGDSTGAASPPPPPPPPPPAPLTLHGVAARGAPLAGATVAVRCARGAAVADATTGDDGAFTVDVPADALPCGFEATGGTAAGVSFTDALHSLVSVEAVVDITPLTDLAIARTALRAPSDWFAGLASSADGTALVTTPATAELLASLAAGGYTVPPAPFDPFTAPFVATSGDAYDGVLDALQASLVAAAQTYADLVATAASADPGAWELPPVTVIQVPGQKDPFILTAKYNAVAADVAPAAGTYVGTLGRIFRPGQDTVETTSCTMTVATDGMLTVSAGDRTLQAAMTGDVGDVILNVIDIQRLLASDTANDRYAQLSTVRGFMAQGVARQGGFGFSDATDRVECLIPNPVITTAGSANVQRVEGATAADFDASLAGTYTGDGCTMTISTGGELHLVTADQDLTGTIGGDEQDLVMVFPSAVVLQAQDYLPGGVEHQISFSYTFANPGLGLPASFSADALVDLPRPRQSLAHCPSLVKQ